MTRALALHATKNTGSKSDATGAFVPEAVSFQRLHACHREGFDNTLAEPARRASVEAIIRRYRDLECVAIFCHGLRRSLQTGHTVSTVGGLADAIAEATGPRVVVALYACSTGATPTGFAAALAGNLYEHGKLGHVDAHDRAGHCCKLPYVRRFTLGGPDNDWIVTPGSDQWDAWRKSLASTNVRHMFPLLTRDQVAAVLAI